MTVCTPWRRGLASSGDEEMRQVADRDWSSRKSVRERLDLEMAGRPGPLAKGQAQRSRAEMLRVKLLRVEL